MHNAQKIVVKSTIWHYLGLILWIVPLLFLNNGHNSLMPHDEAMYAVRSRWLLESGDWITPQSWGELVYEKTPGPYWWLAFVYTIFGISEPTSRLPAQIACIFSLLLTYEIGTILLNKRIAYLASAILGVSLLWLQGSRLATANIVTNCVILLTLWCLLRAELHPKYKYYWGFATGLNFGLSFLLRGQLIFVSAIALLPYLILEHRRHRHLTNPMLYLGLLVGFIPTIAWFCLSWQRYGNIVFEQFFGLAIRIAKEQRNGNSPLFYLWNTPIKAFPWPFFSVLGLLILRRQTGRYRWILVGCPLIMLTQISLVSTRLPHYALILYPFMAMLAAVALDWLCQIYEDKSSTKKWLPRNFSYAFGGFGGLVFVSSILIYTDILPVSSGEIDIKQAAVVGLVLGFGWLMLPLVWILRHRGFLFFTAKYWLANWIIPVWLSLAATGFIGLLGNYSPDIKVFLQQSAIAQVLPNNSINFVVQKTQALSTGGDKALLLLTFYTPHWGQRYRQLSEVPTGNYAWVSPEADVISSSNYRDLGTFRGWKLIYSVSHPDEM
jgi:4-amino-4-deoxy-L-arabinose transferase-like glycosyltransferase